ncbi:MAG: hypothetical protein FJ319_09545 [SAR202 cluster bacterium]|nr:hypothetical protein [SAR202 cluster bacterium]
MRLRPLSDSSGITMIEVLAGLAIVGLLVLPLLGIVRHLVYIPAEWTATVTVANRSRAAVRAISEDARQARTFTPGSGLTYGTFRWTDYVAAPPNQYAVTYFYTTSTATLMRRQLRNGGDPSVDRVAGSIAAVTDVHIRADGNEIVAVATSTADSLKAPVSYVSALRIKMRPDAAAPAPPPIRLARDDFESSGASGGAGWDGNWTLAPTGAEVRPAEGVRTAHLRLAAAGEPPWAKREVTAPYRTKLIVRLSATLENMQAGDHARLIVTQGDLPRGSIFLANTGAPVELILPDPISGPAVIRIEAALTGGATVHIDDLVVFAEWPQ